MQMNKIIDFFNQKNSDIPKTPEKPRPDHRPDHEKKIPPKPEDEPQSPEEIPPFRPEEIPEI